MSADYHLHTPLCRHAVGHPREYVASARARGLTEIGFADHNPFPAPFDDWRMAAEELDQYFALVDEARTPDFPVRLGLECDFVPGYERWIEELAGRASWDYLIGSVHYLGPGWDVDNPKNIHRFHEVPVDEVWDRYWQRLLACIRTGLFDFVAHPDLPKKFGHRPTADPRSDYARVVEALRECDVAFELNTAGWRKPVAEPYPAFPFLAMAAEAGVPVLVNSDAHAPGEVGADFGRAYELLRRAGFKETVRFQNRQRVPVPL